MLKNLSLKTKIKLGLIITVALFILSLILSQNATPDFPPFFNLKRVQEKAYLSLKSSPEAKVDYMSLLLDSRLKELEAQVNNESYNYILPSALRYSTTAGQMTELIIANNLTSHNDWVSELFKKHKQKLNEIYVIYPKNTDNVEYKYIEDDINYLDIYLQKLSSSSK